MNFAALLVGLGVATALWSGVQALNQQARESYDRAAAIFTNGGAKSLVTARGAFIPQDLYIKLRLAGWKTSPVLEGTIRLQGRSLRLIGFEPMTLPRQFWSGSLRDQIGSGELFSGKQMTIASPQTLRELALKDGAPLHADNGKTLPPVTSVGDAPYGTLIVDIGVAQDFLGRLEKLSRLIVGDPQIIAAPPLASVVGDELRFVDAEEENDLARLTDSFHMNLTAFAGLAYLVGLFIVHASFGLAFEQRRPIVRTMRAVGVSVRTLIASMLVELVILATISGAAGLFCGYLIASTLLPDVSASLEDLYGAQLGGRLSPGFSWWASGLSMALVGALVAAGSGLYKTSRLPVLSSAQPFAWRELQQKYLNRQGLFAIAALALSFAAYVLGASLYSGFAVIAGLLLGSAFLLPVIFSALLTLGERFSHGPITQWFWADGRQQLSGLSLALMALLVALSTNVGVGAMVEGFRKTFVEWLDERLVAEAYLEATNNSAALKIESWLGGRPEVLAILPVWKTRIRLSGWPVEVMGLRSHETYREHFQMLSGAPEAWESVQSGAGALISEQLARRLGLEIGSRVEIPSDLGVWRATVVGIYPDYGNAKGQLRVGIDAFAAHWPQAQRTNISLRVARDMTPQLIEALQSEFGGDIARVTDQATVKQISMAIFERTFAVTAALNALTLAVSAIALFASLLALANIRIAQIAPLWAMGVPRARIAQIELARIVLFALATAVAALPLGLALAWCLVSIVNVQAFGWRLPFFVFPHQWAQMFLMAIATAVAASIAPIFQLSRKSPAELLRIFSNER